MKTLSSWVISPAAKCELQLTKHLYQSLSKGLISGQKEVALFKTIVVFKIPGLAQFAVIKLRPFSKVIIFMSDTQNER